MGAKVDEAACHMDCPTSSHLGASSNDVVSLENFPDELWKHIFKLGTLSKFPLKELLTLRTVCHDWNKIICSFSKVNTENVKNLSRLPSIFALRSLSLDTTSTLPDDFLAFTALQTLKVVDDTDPEELSKNLALGHKIKEDPESYLRDYLKRKAYTRVNYPAIKNYIKKTIYRRKVLLKKIKMKNYTYV